MEKFDITFNFVTGDFEITYNVAKAHNMFCVDVGPMVQIPRCSKNICWAKVIQMVAKHDNKSLMPSSQI